MKNKAIMLSALLLAVLALSILAGCGAKDYKGPIKEKVAPQIFWAAIGVSPTHNQNPSLRWYSTDPDGQILDYQFCVLLTTTVDSLGGPEAVAQSQPPSMTWSIVHEDSATIPLYASSDTSVYLEQYVFLKAMDDDSLFSPVIYRSLARNNHAPTCYLIVPWKDLVPNGRRDPSEPIDPQWCLPETTLTWKGIRVAWVGKDSLDIKGIQPDFDWNIRLYGPFADQSAADTLPEHLYHEYTNPTTGSIWIKDKQKYIINLETGMYIVYARNRDDAFVSSVPAVDYLQVYEPTWIRHPEQTKPILLANHNWYSLIYFSLGDLKRVYKDSVENFYRSLFDAAGYPAGQYDWVDYTVVNTENEVRKSDLYSHEMVVILDTDMDRELSGAQELEYGKYLDVGGKIWIIGRKSFVSGGGGRIEFGAASSDHPLAYRYFDFSAIWTPPVSNYMQAEFVGASSLVPGLPDLQIDTAHVNQGTWYRLQSSPDSMFYDGSRYLPQDNVHHVQDSVHYHYTTGNDTSFFAGVIIRTSPPIDTISCYTYHIYLTTPALNGIDYVMRLNNSETIYKYHAADPDTSAFHNFPVATRFDSGTFKTAYFTFPLYFIQRDQAVAVTQAMLDWFLNEE